MSTPDSRLDKHGHPWTLLAQTNHMVEIRSSTGSLAQVSDRAWNAWPHPLEQILLSNPPNQTSYTDDA